MGYQVKIVFIATVIILQFSFNEVELVLWEDYGSGSIINVFISYFIVTITSINDYRDLNYLPITPLTVQRYIVHYKGCFN